MRTGLNGVNYFRLKDISFVVAFTVALVMAAIKLYLVWNSPLIARITEVDDDLFISHAWNILHGKWLGRYNPYTLVKGPGYPLWIALTHFLHIRLLLAQQFLYVFACIVITSVCRPIIKLNVGMLLLFTVLLFNPMSDDPQVTQRAVRDAFYATFIMLLVACNVGLWQARNRSLVTTLGVSSAYGAVLATLWITREENLFLLPLAIMPALCVLVTLYQRKKDCFLRSVSFCSAYVLCCMIVLSIATLNEKTYGFFGITDANSGAFKEAYSAMTSVIQVPYRPEVQLNHATRIKLYRASGTFAKLQPYLEGHEGRLSMRTSCHDFKDICDDIGGGWFGWALTSSVARTGAYASAHTSAAFYHSVAREIRAACTTRRLDCEREHGIGPDIRPQLYAIIFNDALLLSRIAIGFDNFSIGPSETSPDERHMWSRFNEITGETIAVPRFDSYEVLGTIETSNLQSLTVLDRKRQLGRTYVSSANGDHFDIVTPCVDRCTLLLRAGGDIFSFPIRSLKHTGFRTLPFTRLSRRSHITISESLRTLRNDPNTPDSKQLALKYIAHGYQAIFPPFFSISIGLTLCGLIRAFRRRLSQSQLVPFVLMYMFVIMRIALLAVIDVTLNYTFESRYVAPITPCIIIGSIVEVFWAVSIITTAGHVRHTRSLRPA